MVNAFLSGVDSIIVIAVMMSVGILAEKRGGMKNDAEKLLGKLVVNVGLPCTLFYSMTTNFSKEQLIQLEWAAIVPIAVFGFLLLTGMLLARLLKIRRERRGVFICAVAFANLAFIGFPVITSIFGEDVIPLAMVNFLAQAIIFWTIGVGFIRRSAGTEKSDENFFKRFLRVVPPATVSFLLSVIFILAGAQAPLPVEKAVHYLGNLVTPLALIFSGVMIARQKISDFIPDRDVIIVVISRFALAPVVTWIFCRLTGLNSIVSQVMILQLSMPIMTQITIISALYGADHRFAIKCFALSTLLLFVYVPLASIALNLLFV